jgi:uncharacterized protein
MEMPKQGEFCWTELATNNLDGAADFYEKVFGWEIQKGDNSADGMEYREFSPRGGEPMGGMYDMKAIFGDNQPPPHFVNYIAVDDVDALAARVESLGGKCCHEPKDIPNVGRMVTISDPAGAVVVLITLGEQS